MAENIKFLKVATYNIRGAIGTKADEIKAAAGKEDLDVIILQEVGTFWEKRQTLSQIFGSIYDVTWSLPKRTEILANLKKKKEAFIRRKATREKWSEEKLEAELLVCQQLKPIASGGVVILTKKEITDFFIHRQCLEAGRIAIIRSRSGERGTPFTSPVTSIGLSITSLTG